jgi:hypothetical protein
MNHLYARFKHFIQLFLLITLSAFLVYYVPAVISRWLFLLFLIPMWRSKNDFFWFAFLLILLDRPGGLFSGRGLVDVYQIPVYNLIPQMSISFYEVCIFLFFIKAVFKKRFSHYRSFVYKNWYRNLGIYLIILIFISLFLGMSIDAMRNVYRIIISLSLYFSAVFIFTKEEDVIGFFKAIFPFTVVSFLLQIYGMVFHQQLVALFFPGVPIIRGVLAEGELQRPIEMVTVQLLCFFGSFLYLNLRRKVFSNFYLLTINITSYIGIFIMATRSWTLGLTIMYFLYFLFNIKKTRWIFRNVAIGLGLFLLAMYLSPLIKNQIDQSWTRMETMELIFKGDLTAGGTLSRLTERGPRVMEGFSKSTIVFGAGFSDLYFEYADGHVGFQSILLNTGIIGFVLLLSFAFTLFLKPYNISKKVDVRSDLKSILKNLSLLIPTIMVINSGTQFWGYSNFGLERVLLLTVYISISSVYINEYKLLRISANHKNNISDINYDPKRQLKLI